MTMPKPPKEKFQFKAAASGKVAYLSIPRSQPSPRKVARNIRLNELMEGYSGPDVILDFDAEKQLMGIEILLP